VFNVTGGEFLIIMVIALVVLGPEKLPDMIRKVGRVYGELRRMSSGFQDELRSVIDEPLREVRETMDMARGGFTSAAAEPEPGTSPVDRIPDADSPEPELIELPAAEPDATAMPEANAPPAGSARASSSDAWWFEPHPGGDETGGASSWAVPSPVERRPDLPPPPGRELPPPTSGPVA
jgi:sec-independent protein translocase protein TatB